MDPCDFRASDVDDHPPYLVECQAGVAAAAIGRKVVDLGEGGMVLGAALEMVLDWPLSQGVHERQVALVQVMMEAASTDL